MKLFENSDTTLWCKLELCLNSDEDFLTNFGSIFYFYEDSEYHPKAEMKFYIEIKGEDIWVEITQEDGMDSNFKLKIDDKEIDFEENTAECILQAIKNNLID